jgi:hypothetical protein
MWKRWIREPFAWLALLCWLAAIALFIWAPLPRDHRNPEIWEQRIENGWALEPTLETVRDYEVLEEEGAVLIAGEGGIERVNLRTGLVESGWW